MSVISGGITIGGGIIQPGSGLAQPILSAGAPGAGTSAVQSIAATGGTVSGGTFRVGFGGAYTAALAYNIANAALDTALEGITGSGTVTIGGGPLPVAVTVTFGGALANQPVNLLTVDGSALTGGGTYTAANSVAGVNNTARGIATGGLLRDTTTGSVYKNSGVPPATSWSAPLTLEEQEAEEEPEDDEGTPKKRNKSIKSPPEDKSE